MAGAITITIHVGSDDEAAKFKQEVTEEANRRGKSLSKWTLELYRGEMKKRGKG